MFSNLIRKYNFIVKDKEKRSIIANRNAFISLLIKLVGVTVGLIFVPVSLNFLDAELYGIWIAIYSILFWISYFNLGLGHGLRNYLSESLAKDNLKLSKDYVSTTYFLLFLIFLTLNIILLIINHFIDWTNVFSCDKSFSHILTQLISIVFSFSCIRFILQLIIQVYEANQRVAYGNTINVVGQVLSVLVILVVSFFDWKNKLLTFGVVITAIPVFVLIIFSIIAFRGVFKHISPSVSNINLSYSRKLLGLGSKFLIIQIAILVITQLPNILVAKHFGPENVALFFTTQKYFSVIYMIYSIVMQSYWPAFTEAYTKNDLMWIKKSFEGLKKLILFLSAIGFIMLIISNFVISKWTLNKVTPNFLLSLLSYIYYVVVCFGGIYSTFLGAINRLNTLLVSYIIGALIFYPLVLLFIKYTNLGMAGIVLSMIISSFAYITAPFEVNALLKRVK